jgi:catechol 2,3-dioxygenase-like lactoylglutathione lyase family enzyme
MIDGNKAFSGFAVDDLEAAKEFYSDKLGLDVADGPMGILALKVGGGNDVLVYPKADHEPATYTILNFPVDNIDEAVDELSGKGIEFEHYTEGQIKTDEKGVARGLADGRGPDIAWFKDPAGNIIAVLQNS